MRRIPPVLAFTVLLATPASAQLATDLTLPRPAGCCLVNTASALAEQLQDWNQLGRYYAANEELKKQPAGTGRVVFLGDSITDNWRLAESFPGKPYVNRGISGQVTSQMLVRMYPDVIALKPAAMVLLAGTNDIARNNGPITLEMLQQNYMAIADLAVKNGIKLILCSITPVNDYTNLPAGRGAGPGTVGPKRMQTVGRPPADILRVNAWLREYATKIGAVYADYFAAVLDEKGMLKDGLSADGLHPNANGYQLMAPVVEAAIQRALGSGSTTSTVRLTGSR